MSKAANSPTARLLRSSRLFSLPRPLPQPGLDSITSSGVYRASDTATLPYPVHQAIVTPASSHFRGDWGLKRPLPTKATKGTSTPHIRVIAQDTPEHITDFGSAADHTQTAAKWREMNIPLIQRQPRHLGSRRPAPMSVFEDHLDNTDPDSRSTSVDSQSRRGQHNQILARTEPERWKYKGPWIAGMQDGEFEAYITNAVARKKTEWHAFLRNAIADKQLADARRQAQEEGEPLSLEAQEELRKKLIPSDDELHVLQKRMRDGHAVDGLSSELTSLVCKFLDLPAVRSVEQFEPSAQSDFLRRTLDSINSSDAETTPPSTHPSAGLSYLRSNAVMENHPIHGPQAHRSPVLSRVVRPRNAVQGTEFQAKLGVGGIVTADPVSTTHTPARRAVKPVYDADQMANTLDPDLAGGNKMWVHPQTAYIDEKGRIRLDVTRGDKEAIAVKTDDVAHIHEARSAASRMPAFTDAMGGAQAPRGTAGNANYGYSLSDTRTAQSGQRRVRAASQAAGYPPARRGPEVKGFDEELGRSAKDGPMDSGSATARIRQLLEERSTQ